jgi:hypothetical protein
MTYRPEHTGTTIRSCRPGTPAQDSRLPQGAGRCPQRAGADLHQPCREPACSAAEAERIRLRDHAEEMRGDLDEARKTIEIYHLASMALDGDALVRFCEAFREIELEFGYDPDE